MFGILVFVISVCVSSAGIWFDCHNFLELSENQQQIEKTGIERCETGVQVYPWIYLVFVILKILFVFFDNTITGLSLHTEYIGKSNYNLYYLIIAFFTSVCQFFDLLILVIFSCACLLPEGENVFHDLISDVMNDFLSGIFGTLGLILNVVVKNNFTAVCSIFISCKEQNNVKVRVISVLVLLTVFFCVILTSILLRNYMDM